MADMLAITAPKYGPPAIYETTRIPRPLLSKSTEVLIQIHAASVNPADTKMASGMMKMVKTDPMPLKIGYDCSGVVLEVGTEVTRVKKGDRVYSRLPEVSRGAWSEYAVCPEEFVGVQPASLSFADAASIPLAAATAYQGLLKFKGSLEGKTVFVPAGLSGTGAYACQLAKNVFGAGKVITTVSTAKVPKVDEHLGKGVVDQIIDYTKEDPAKVIPAKSVDFLFDTTGQAMAFLSLMRPSTGTVISIATGPSAAQIKDSDFFRASGKTSLPWVLTLFLDVTDIYRKWRASRWSVSYEFLFLESTGADLDKLRGFVDEKKLRPVVGTRIDIHDVDRVRAVCGQIFAGKGGGVGKTIIDVVNG